MNQIPVKATHQQTKTYNSQLVLKTIFDHTPISRADVARLTHLTRVTVSEIVAELLERGLVAEVGRGPSTGGKSPIFLGIVDDAWHLISLDLGNEVFRGAVVNLRGKICHSITLPIHPDDGNASLQTLQIVYELIEALKSVSDRPLLGIGIGTPGLIDTTQGIVLQAVNLNWQNLHLGGLLSDRFGLPVYLANDSQVAALAEQLFGDCELNPNSITIKIGQGIGSGILINGHLHQGEGYGAGEIGHVQVVENGLPCRCGNLGCLETVASCRAIVDRAQALVESYPDSILNRLSANPQSITFEMIAYAYRSGDKLARLLASEVAHYLSISISHLIGALNIQDIFIVGDITAFGKGWLETLIAETHRRSLSSLAQKTRIRYGCLGSDVVILGASALLLTHELGLNLTRYPIYATAGDVV